MCVPSRHTGNVLTVYIHVYVATWTTTGAQSAHTDTAAAAASSCSLLGLRRGSAAGAVHVHAGRIPQSWSGAPGLPGRGLSRSPRSDIQPQGRSPAPVAVRAIADAGRQTAGQDFPGPVAKSAHPTRTTRVTRVPSQPELAPADPLSPWPLGADLFTWYQSGPVFAGAHGLAGALRLPWTQRPSDP